MKVISDIPCTSLPPAAATIGFFDGVHRGHRYLIEQVREVAAERGLCATVITFPVHPRQVIQSAYRPQLLSAPQEKLQLLEQTGVDHCLLLPFTPQLSLLSARAFMQLLHDRYHVRALVIGYDHHFGHNRSEGFDDYCRYGEELGIYIVRARAYQEGETQISSSAIRRLLQEGEVEQAAHFLGYPYHLDGTVTDGYKVGRTLGFPTANLCPACPDQLVPREGVYAVWVYVHGQKYAGMLNIGYRPTLDNGSNRSIEVNILRFSADIYRQPMRLEFVRFLRPEEKFDSLEALIAQMKKDQAVTEALLL